MTYRAEIEACLYPLFRGIGAKDEGGECQRIRWNEVEALVLRTDGFFVTRAPDGLNGSRHLNSNNVISSFCV
jgi:hypothetical protein